MDCSISLASLLFFLSSFFYLSVVSITATQSSYGQSCGSVVHELKPGDEEFNISPFPERQYGYYSGGDKVMNLSSVDDYYSPEYKVLVFETHHVHKTDAEDVFKVEGNLIFQTSFYYERSFNYDGPIYSSSDSSRRGTLDFDFQGFWSRTTGKLCMVGSSYTYSKDGKLLHLQAVLKLNNVKDSSTINTLVTGTMDSLNAADHEPNLLDQISLLMFPQLSYKYTKTSKQFSQGCPGGTDIPDKSSLSLPRTRTICNMLSGRGYAFELVYASGCDSSKDCNPFGDVIGYLPQFISLSMIECSQDKQSLRFLIQFSNNSYMGYYGSFSTNTSLVGEGSWDAKKNQLCAIACRIHDASGSLDKSYVGDCTTRLSLRFPAILSIGSTSTVVGEIWSEKQRNDSGFFDKIVFRNTDHRRGGIQLQGLKYEYTETDKVKKLCPKKNPTGNSKGEYPDVYSSGSMSFSISIRNPKGRTGWGSADIISVGDEPHQRFPSLIPSSSSMPINRGVESDTTPSLLNVSYKISLPLNSKVNPFNQSSEGDHQEIQISAEGLYDAETGNLCMVGCGVLRSENKAFLSQSMDCQIHVGISFPPSNSDRKNSIIKGTIKSLRGETDPLYLGPIHFTGRPYFSSWAMESIWRMDLEVIMSVISNTLAIVFVALQIFHMRRHPGVRPFVSILMLAVLALGYLIPLVLNLEAIFTQDTERSVWIRGGTWLEMNEVIVRVVTMVAFLLHLRLLMLSWTFRCSDGKKKALWVAEKRGLLVCLPLYIVGAVIAFFVKWRKNLVVTGRRALYDRQQMILGVSRSYSGLILDAFLFPQILFNMFENSREQALSRFFYIGITLVRLVPHGYDLYRAHSYVDIDDTYIYADPAADYYSTAWDIIIIVLGLLLAAIINSQQRFGGRCLLPKRFQESVTYEELPVDSEEQLPQEFSN